jgi:pyruvate, orthophosphate dikinase
LLIVINVFFGVTNYFTPEIMPNSSRKDESASTKQYIYSFAGGAAEGDASMKNLLGGKGANLAEMANIGLPVPPGFTLSTEICTYYYDHQ